MITREEDSRTADRLWAEYAQTHDPRTREAIIHQFERLAYRIANRYARKGTDNEDIFQVAMMGLVKAVDRFDPSTRHRFSTFATPTIVGEIRRYFRDHSWNLHVPRGLQELSAKVERVSRSLSRDLGRTPRAREIADVLGVSEREVDEALGLELANHPLSLDGPIETSDGDGTTLLEDTLGAEDRDFRSRECEIAVDQILPRLAEPLREVIELRYLGELSQREVARRLHLSQMQVSRMEKSALATLRVACGVG